MARCTNCNAPLADGSILCSYCGVRNDIDLKGINYYTSHECDSPRICPRCNIRLKTVDLKLNGTFLIERCEECLGIFFDPGELEALLDAEVSNVFRVDLKTLNSINANRPPDSYPVSYIKCPVCTQLMNRENYGAKSGVIVDHCKSHGVWLDGGELRRLFEWVKLGGKQFDLQHREEVKKEALLREKEQRHKLLEIADEQLVFGQHEDLFRQQDPAILTLIVKALGALLG